MNFFGDILRTHTFRNTFCFAVILVGLFRPGLESPVQADETSASFIPGLVLTFESSVPNTAPDSRAARLISLRVPEGTSPTPFLPPGSFRATWQGSMDLDLRGDFTFTADGTGSFKLLLNDQLALEIQEGAWANASSKTIRLNKGPNHLVAIYQSPTQGDAFVRLHWSSSEFAREPIAPAVFTRSPKDPSLQHGKILRLGREVIASSRCLKCHVAEPDLARNFAMPELAMDAPALEGIGSRLESNWIAHWIENPRALRPDASMPQLHLTPQDISDLSAFLGSQGDALGPLPTASDTTIASGEHLFSTLGCIACHTLPGASAIVDPANRIPLRFVKAKWKPTSLRDYLLAPEKQYAWTRMPNFKLNEIEATQLTAFLIDRAKGELTPSPLAGNADRGKKLVETSGCLNCHTLKLDNTYQAPSLATLRQSKLDRGCLAVDPAARGNAPDFSLTPEQREALRELKEQDSNYLQQDSPIEFAERQIQQLQCLACHTRDNQMDLWSGQFASETAKLGGPPALNEDEGPTGVDQTRPSLTWTGEKLKPEWMKKFIAGEISYKPRTWLAARMPAFPARAAGLAKGLALEQGCERVSPPTPSPDSEKAKIGEQLTRIDGGFSCVNCHPVGSNPAVAPFEAPSINFTQISERLRPDYFLRWMRSPLRIQPGTKMPQFADDSGHTTLTDVYDGDAEKQFEAIWDYLKSIENKTR